MRVLVLVLSTEVESFGSEIYALIEVLMNPDNLAVRVE